MIRVVQARTKRERSLKALLEKENVTFNVIFFKDRDIDCNGEMYDEDFCVGIETNEVRVSQSLVNTYTANELFNMLIIKYKKEELNLC